MLAVVVLAFGGFAAFESRSGPGADGDAIVSRTSVVDPDGAWTAAEASRAEGEPVDRIVAHGYGSGALWLRLDLAPIGDDRVLRVKPANLDEVDVYVAANGDAYASLARLGDRRPRPEASEYGPARNVRLPASPSGGSLLLSVRTSRSASVSADVITVRSYARDALVATALAAVYAFSLLVAGSWAVFAHDRIGRRVAAWFVAFLVSAAAFTLSVLGFVDLMAQRAPPGLSASVSSLSIFALVGSGFALHAVLMRSLGLPRGVVRVGLALASASFALAVLHLAGAERTALAVNGALGLAFVPFAVAGAVWAPANVRVPRGVLRGAYLALAVVTSGQVLAVLGLLPPSSFTAYATPIPVIPTIGLVLWLIARYPLEDRAPRREGRISGASAAERAAFEAEQRVGAETFLARLAETLRNSLSVISAALANEPVRPSAASIAREAVHDADGALRRAELLLALERGRFEVAPHPADVATMVAEALVRSDLDERTNVSGPASELLVDRRILARVLTELFDNVRRYADPEAAVEVSWAETSNGGGVRLIVRSPRGAVGSIDPSLAFERYERGARATARTGTGLGLYLVREMARLHGGDARYEDDGATISVEVTLRA